LVNISNLYKSPLNPNLIMALYQRIRELWKNPKESLGPLWQERLVQWRQEPSSVRIERPTRLDRARSLGYKAKQGIILIRQRVDRGGRLNKKYRKRRMPRHASRRKDLAMSYQWIAEQRAQKRHVNCEVLNSYYVAHDGTYFWYEVILVDRAHPVILADKNLSGVAFQKGRVYRGLTSAGKKTRGLLHKGKGAEKLRPSKTANRKVRLTDDRTQ